MRLLYIVDQFPVASETFVAAEIEGMRQRGHVVEVAALKRPTPGTLQKMGPGLRSLIAGTHYVPRISALASARYFWTPSAHRLNWRIAREATCKAKPLLRLTRAMTVARLADQLRAQRIHAHWPRPTEVALLASLLTGLPVSASIHAHEVAHDNGHFPAAFEMLDFATFCNTAAMELLLSKLADPAQSRSHLIYHGVDASTFPQVALPSIDGVLRIVTAGRLTPTKGFDRLIEAVGRAKGHGLEVSLTILGDGGGKDRLVQLAAALGVGDQIDFAGWLPHEQMHGMLAQHHLFALLADDSFHDGLPNVVLEAMATGLPVILSPLPAAKEAVVDGKSGLILSAVDAVDEMVELCIRLWSEPDRLRSLGDAAARAVRLQHDRSAQLDRLAALFSVSDR